MHSHGTVFKPARRVAEERYPEESRFDWDAGNAPHIALRGIARAATEEAMADPLQVAFDARSDHGELRPGVVGRTRSGQLLVVIYTMRGDRYGVVTTWPARGRYARVYWEANR